MRRPLLPLLISRGVTMHGQIPGELSPTQARMVGTPGWWTVAYVVPVKRLRKVSDGVDDEGKPLAHMETVDETNLVVRGWKEDGAFLAAWSADGKADVAYWWTRDHEAWAELPRQLVTWTTPTPTPVKVGFARLKKLLKK